MTVLDTSCGLGSFRPDWLQRFASTRWFLVVYTFLGVVQSMSFSYTSSTITTLEKRFKIPSKVIGVLMSGNEVSQICLSLIMAYYGGRGSRPLWISWGVMFSALSCYILVLPHVLYGAGREALALTEEYLDYTAINSSGTVKHETPLLCFPNQTLDATCEEDISSGEHSILPLALIFLSQFVLGIGTTLCHTLGKTYLDDSIKKTNAPLMFDNVTQVSSTRCQENLTQHIVHPFPRHRASNCFRSILYNIEMYSNVIKNGWTSDWIRVDFFLFEAVHRANFDTGHNPFRSKMAGRVVARRIPKKVKNTQEKEGAQETGVQPKYSQNGVEKSNHGMEIPIKIIENEMMTFKKDKDKNIEKIEPVDDNGFIVSLKRLLRNQMLMYNIWSATFFIIVGSGHMAFSMKYTETQYHMSASGASMLSGGTRVLAMVFGFMLSGYLMGKYKPRPRIILGWNVFLGLLYVGGSIFHIFLKCDDNGLYGLDMDDGKLDIYNDCNMNCACEAVKYQPVCYVEKDMTFYSPCQLGCKTKFLSPNGSLTSFGECSCVPEEISVPFSQLPEVPVFTNDSAVVTIMNGPCPVYISTAITKHLNFSGISHKPYDLHKQESRLLGYSFREHGFDPRCVEPRDKVLAQGLSLLLVSLFGFIPGPIIFGALVDSACLVWDASCGEKGNCWLYHKYKFRLYLDGFGAAVMCIGVLLDIKTWQIGKNLNLYDEEEEEIQEKEYNTSIKRKGEK
uniref:Kazal-like domain-containing protein n=1 Tax=Timema cristinae TaxID=61476 RepID=A0A7R9CNJ5_TIMCR|nr:unnamed protein product [Timema cristinae]